MKVGDLVKRKGTDELAIIVRTEHYEEDSPYNGNGYARAIFVWASPGYYYGRQDSCSCSLLEVISESR